MSARRKTPAAPTRPGNDGKSVHEVLSPLRHDGERYEPGEFVSLTAAEAAALAAIGVVAATPVGGSGEDGTEA